MSTKIEWTDETWNPVTGCSKISAGCKNCYAERMAKRLAGRFGYPDAPNSFDVTLHPDRLEEPLRWRNPRKVFVCSMSDLFHPDVPKEFIWKVLEVAWKSDNHIFQILTKRPKRMRHIYSDLCGNCLEDTPLNIWLGVTAENQETADERIPILLETPAAVRFVSVEPILGPVDLWPYLQKDSPHFNHKLDWVIAGGETGPGARPPHPDWFRALRDQCAAADVPFFFKQWGGPHKKGWVIVDELYTGNVLDGDTWEQFPDPYVVVDPWGKQLVKATQEELEAAKKKIEEAPKPLCPVCEQEFVPYAYNTGDGWWLYWDCRNEDHIGMEPKDIDWPWTEDTWVDTSMLTHIGCVIV